MRCFENHRQTMQYLDGGTTVGTANGTTVRNVEYALLRRGQDRQVYPGSSASAAAGRRFRGVRCFSAGPVPIDRRAPYEYSPGPEAYAL